MILTLITNKPPEIRGSIMGRRLLSLSYHHTLAAILNGTVTESHLATALFYFGCVRDHFFEEGSAVKEFERTQCNPEPSEIKRIFELLKDAVLIAEAQGRAAWRVDEHTIRSYGMVNELLSRNGFEKLPLPADSGPKFRPREVARIAKGLVGDELLVIPAPQEER